MTLRWTGTIAAAAIALAISIALAETGRADTRAAGCSDIGAWIDVRTGEPLSPPTLFDGLAAAPVVLLGETHDNVEHHRWQLQALSALHSRAGKLVIGFESFPRRVQGVLDRWSAGKLSEKAFLKAVDWQRVWGFDPGLYMPLFHFARMNRVAMVALNVDRRLVSRVGAEGWDAIPDDEREGVGKPAAAAPGYLRGLAAVYAEKLTMRGGGSSVEGMSSLDDDAVAGRPTAIDDVLERPGFKRFVAAQLTWDRAMAEALARARRDNPGALVVGVIGSGHLEHFHGVPHQLDDLGITDAKVLIPVDAGKACEALPGDYADAVYTVRPVARQAAAPRRQLLGVRMVENDRGVVVAGVLPDSVAESAGIEEDDRIVRAAGVDVKRPATLVEIVTRHAPGTWLPVVVERGGKQIELVAKFPAATTGDQ